MKPTDQAKTIEILQDIFIAMLVNASVPKHAVRKIVKVDLNRVTRIGKLLKTPRKPEE